MSWDLYIQMYIREKIVIFQALILKKSLSEAYMVALFFDKSASHFHLSISTHLSLMSDFYK